MDLEKQKELLKEYGLTLNVRISKLFQNVKKHLKGDPILQEKYIRKSFEEEIEKQKK